MQLRELEQTCSMFELSNVSPAELRGAKLFKKLLQTEIEGEDSYEEVINDEGEYVEEPAIKNPVKSIIYNTNFNRPNQFKTLTTNGFKKVSSYMGNMDKPVTTFIKVIK